MDTKKTNYKIGVLIIMVVAAAMSRLLPHPPNFTPIGAMALFGAAYFPKKWMAVVVPLLSLWLSSMILDNVFFSGSYAGVFQWFSQPFVFLAFGLTVAIGWLLLKKVSAVNVLAAAVASSLIFFLVVNFGFWLSFSPVKNVATLMASYTAAIPFDLMTLTSNLIYSAILFGAYETLKQGVPALQTVKN
jgi:hypothetical protein